MNIISQIESLRRLTHELLHLGIDGAPLYTDHFCRLNKEVLELADSLYSHRGTTSEEEATLCFALLIAYGATIYDSGNKEQKKQSILNRSWKVLDKLPSSLLRCQLLIACYGEVFDEELAQKAHAIIDSWARRELSIEELEAVEMLQGMEENQYPNSNVE